MRKTALLLFAAIALSACGDPASTANGLLRPQATLSPASAASADNQENNDLATLRSATARFHRYDVARQELTLDRQHSGNVAFHPMFAMSLETAKVPLRDGQLQLRLLVDKSVVEVFAQDGETTLTDLVFPRQHAGRITLTADGAAQVTALRLTDLSQPIVP